MRQALKTPFIIHFWGWKNSTFQLLALWGNKNLPPSMKVKKIENLQNKRGLKGCKWSNLKPQSTEKPLSHSLLGLEEFPFLHYWPSGVIRIGSPAWKYKIWKSARTRWAQGAAIGPVWMPQGQCLSEIHKLNKNWEWNWLKGLQMIQFECPRD